MSFSSEEAIIGTKKILEQKVFSLIRPEFSDYDPIYPFTTENLSYLKKLKVKEKDVLTVCGSFDQCLNLAYKGTKSVVNFDTNYLSLVFGALKLAAIQALDYNEFIYFFVKDPSLEKEGNFNFKYEVYLKLRPFLPNEAMKYWDQIYEMFAYDGKQILESRLFHTGADNLDHILFSNPYLRTEKNYLKTKENCKDMTIDFEFKNLLEVGKGDEEKYDLMLFSNIESYLTEDLFGCMSEEEFSQFIEQEASKELKEGGTIQVAYQYNRSQSILVYGNFFQKLWKKNYVMNPKNYMDDKYKKVVFQGMPLNSGYALSKDVKDCVYLYQKERRKAK